MNQTEWLLEIYKGLCVFICRQKIIENPLHHPHSFRLKSIFIFPSSLSLDFEWMDMNVLWLLLSACCLLFACWLLICYHESCIKTSQNHVKVYKRES